MAREKRSGITATLRERITRGLRSEALKPGARLPGVRELAAEFRSDPRVVALAYQTLAKEGLIEVRPRSGAYVAVPSATQAAHDGPPAGWLADVLAEGVRRGVAAPSLPDALRAAIAARRVRAVVLTGIRDQSDGLARELRDDYGLDAAGLMFGAMGRGEPLPRALRQANLIVTTQANHERVKRLANRLGKPHVVACVRPDLLSLEWRSLMRGLVYVIVADPHFVKVVREFVGDVEGNANVRILVAGRDDLSIIPEDAPTYLTESARERLGRTRLPGRIVTPARILSDDCVSQVMRVIVDLNIASRVRPGRRTSNRRPYTHR